MLNATCSAAIFPAPIVPSSRSATCTAYVIGAPGVKKLRLALLTSTVTAGGVLPAMMSTDPDALPPDGSVTVRVAE